MSIDVEMGYRIDLDELLVRAIARHPGEDHVHEFWSMDFQQFLDAGERLLDSLLATLKRVEICQEMLRAGLPMAEVQRQLHIVNADDA